MSHFHATRERLARMLHLANQQLDVIDSLPLEMRVELREQVLELKRRVERDDTDLVEDQLHWHHWEQEQYLDEEERQHHEVE